MGDRYSEGEHVKELAWWHYLVIVLEVAFLIGLIAWAATQ